jgi:hypothetical protein
MLLATTHQRVNDHGEGSEFGGRWLAALDRQ